MSTLPGAVATPPSARRTAPSYGAPIHAPASAPPLPAPAVSDTQTLRTAHQQAIRSILLIIFSLAVSVYFTGLYFEVFAPPTAILSPKPAFEELPPGPDPAIDRSGRLIHTPPGIARDGVEVALSMRTVIGNWDVTCVYRPLGGSRWARSPMTSFSEGRHSVMLPVEALASGAAEYYFEGVKLSSGERVQSGRPEAPFRIQTR